MLTTSLECTRKTQTREQQRTNDPIASTNKQKEQEEGGRAIHGRNLKER